jgi:hypothetical protein
MHGQAQEHHADIVAGRSICYLEEAPADYFFSNRPFGTRIYAGKRETASMLCYYHSDWLVHWGKLYKTGLYKNAVREALILNYRQEARGAEDTSLLFSCIEKCDRIVMTDEIVYYYTGRSASLANNCAEYSSPMTRRLCIYKLYRKFCEDDAGLAKEKIAMLDEYLEQGFAHDLRVLEKAWLSGGALAAKLARQTLQDSGVLALEGELRFRPMIRKLKEMADEA